VSRALLILVICLGPKVLGEPPAKEHSAPDGATTLARTNADPEHVLAKDPIFVYNNWSAYDELSDNIPLTEQLAMKELDQILRLRHFGARFDYYMMDAFWFDPDGGYRTWRKPNWPNGPDEWVRKCRANGILPGLWFSTNTLVKVNATDGVAELAQREEERNVILGGWPFSRASWTHCSSGMTMAFACSSLIL